MKLSSQACKPSSGLSYPTADRSLHFFGSWPTERFISPANVGNSSGPITKFDSKQYCRIRGCLIWRWAFSCGASFLTTAAYLFHKPGPGWKTRHFDAGFHQNKPTFICTWTCLAFLFSCKFLLHLVRNQRHNVLESTCVRTVHLCYIASCWWPIPRRSALDGGCIIANRSSCLNSIFGCASTWEFSPELYGPCNRWCIWDLLLNILCPRLHSHNLRRSRHFSSSRPGDGQNQVELILVGLVRQKRKPVCSKLRKPCETHKDDTSKGMPLRMFNLLSFGTFWRHLPAIAAVKKATLRWKHKLQWWSACIVSHLGLLDGRFKGHGLKAMIEDRGENNNNGKTEPTCTKLPGFSEWRDRRIFIHHALTGPSWPRANGKSTNCRARAGVHSSPSVRRFKFLSHSQTVLASRLSPFLILRRRKNHLDMMTWWDLDLKSKTNFDKQSGHENFSATNCCSGSK